MSSEPESVEDQVAAIQDNATDAEMPVVLHVGQANSGEMRVHRVELSPGSQPLGLVPISRARSLAEAERLVRLTLEAGMDDTEDDDTDAIVYVGIMARRTEFGESPESTMTQEQILPTLTIIMQELGKQVQSVGEYQEARHNEILDAITDRNGVGHDRLRTALLAQHGYDAESDDRIEAIARELRVELWPEFLG